jgi:hypothetical protein
LNNSWASLSRFCILRIVGRNESGPANDAVDRKHEIIPLGQLIGDSRGAGKSADKTAPERLHRAMLEESRHHFVLLNRRRHWLVIDKPISKNLVNLSVSFSLISRAF